MSLECPCRLHQMSRWIGRAPFFPSFSMCLDIIYWQLSCTSLLQQNKALRSSKCWCFRAVTTAWAGLHPVLGQKPDPQTLLACVPLLAFMGMCEDFPLGAKQETSLCVQLYLHGVWQEGRAGGMDLCLQPSTWSQLSELCDGIFPHRQLPREFPHGKFVGLTFLFCF